jgi:thioredoxin-like negative regulator of GroEL
MNCLLSAILACCRCCLAALLQVRSTPAFFLFQAGDLVCHFSGADSLRLEAEVRRRIPLSAELPASPIFSADEGDE